VGNVEFFNYFGSMRTDGSRWALEIKYGNGMAKSAFIKKKILFTIRLDFKRQKLIKCYIWRKVVCGAETSTLWKGDRTRGANKSLAQPGRKQATATKCGIYSTCSPRSSIHFLARCSNFCKPLKKKKS